MEQITLHLHEPNKPTRDVCVCRNDPIQVLQNEVKGNDKRYVLYKRSILMTSFSFKYFGINDGDDLYVVHMPQNKGRRVSNNNLMKILKKRISLPSGEVEIDRTAVQECVRLMDLMYIRDEFRPKVFRESIVENTSNEKKETQRTVYKENQATEPSTECLPIFWENRRRLLHRV